jgi:two-component system phosphate regulon response regulator PhoB
MNRVQRQGSWNSTDPRVTIVEADCALALTLSHDLRTEGYFVESVNRGEQALRRLTDAPPDLLILDWMLPGMSGPDICIRLRAEEATRMLPVIMLSARGEEALRLRGFSAGADDFVVKPFSTRELIARVRALLRRSRFGGAEHPLTRGDLQLDPKTRRVRRGSRYIHLRPKEFGLLKCLAERPGRVFSRQQLLERVWGPSVDINDRTVDVHIGRLRKALSSARERDPILSVLGAGYYFNGKQLNSPNGVIVKSDDTVWFTDPSYGIGGDHEGNRGEAELPRNVYRLDPKSGQMDVVVGDFSMPNGLCFSPDEKKFYVTDTGELGGAFKQTLIRVYDVGDDGKLSNGRLLHDFKDVPQPYIADDIRADEDGNIWAAGGWSPNHAMNGVRVFAPDVPMAWPDQWSALGLRAPGER